MTNFEDERLKKQQAEWKASTAEQQPDLPPKEEVVAATAERKNLGPEDSEKIYAGELIGKGGNSKAYNIEGRPDEVLLVIGEAWGGQQSEETLKNGLERLHQKIEMFKNLPPGVQAPKILKAWTKDGSLYQVMEKAKGNAIHNRKGTFEDWQQELETLANAPEEHYTQLMNDIKVLHETGFKVDPSKPDNFYYDSQTGFHFIDLEPGQYIGSMEVPLIHTYNLFTKYSDKISPEVKQAIRKILDKLSKAGDEPSEDMLTSIESKIRE